MRTRHHLLTRPIFSRLAWATIALSLPLSCHAAQSNAYAKGHSAAEQQKQDVKVVQQAASTKASKLTYVSDVSAIAHLLASTYDRPDAKLETSPIVVVDDYAIADWIQANKGGRALLVKQHGEWSIHLCGGKGLVSASNLQAAGLPKSTATQLATALQNAEKTISKERISLFDSFGQTIRFDSASHPKSHH